MEIGETLYVVDRKPWREWLEANFDTARKRPEIFESRLKNFLKATEKGRQIGYGGIDKYF
ncbi:MAG: hypothetical protein F7B06_11305 [Opitutae bacterium]|nr:hypothetical protein [Opitutae bacterium]